MPLANRRSRTLRKQACRYGVAITHPTDRSQNNAKTGARRKLHSWLWRMDTAWILIDTGVCRSLDIDCCRAP